MIVIPGRDPESIASDDTRGERPLIRRFAAPSLTRGEGKSRPSALIVFVRSHRPGPLIMAVGVVAVGLQRIAVDEGAQIHRMGGAAHLVLDGEQVPAAVEIDDVLEAILVLIVFLGDEAAL